MLVISGALITVALLQLSMLTGASQQLLLQNTQQAMLTQLFGSSHRYAVHKIHVLKRSCCGGVCKLVVVRIRWPSREAAVPVTWGQVLCILYLDRCCIEYIWQRASSDRSAALQQHSRAGTALVDWLTNQAACCSRLRSSDDAAKPLLSAAFMRHPRCSVLFSCCSVLLSCGS
jgi:hypothetical protein